MSTGSSPSSAGKRLRAALDAECPLQIVGTVNAYAALLARTAGFRAIYISGAGVANASLGVPDLGITSINDLCEDARRITGATDLPLLVDADTGFGGAFNIARTCRDLLRSGVAGMHLEDQVQAKRCGHRPGKALVAASEMADRLKAAVDAREDPDFVIMARTDAHAVEGQQAAVERALQYVAAGADMIFAEALTSLEEYRQFTASVGVPVLANHTECGNTPRFTVEELARVGVRLVLYPLSAFRAMSQAALTVYETIRREGTQKAVVPSMQTREELYAVLGYHAYEEKLDRLFGRDADKT
jgi:methylisocitrate lyase